MSLEKARYDGFCDGFDAGFEETNNPLFLSIALVVTYIFIVVFESTGNYLYLSSSNAPIVAAGLYMVSDNAVLKLQAQHYFPPLFQFFLIVFLQILKYQELVILIYFTIFCCYFWCRFQVHWKIFIFLLLFVYIHCESNCKCWRHWWYVIPLFCCLQLLNPYILYR